MLGLVVARLSCRQLAQPLPTLSIVVQHPARLSNLRTISGTHGNQSYIYTINLQYTPFQGIGSGHRRLIAVTCIAEHASAATYTNAHALAKPQADPCPMPSAAGKRVERVLAGCSKPEAGDKPLALYLARDTRY